MKSAKIQNWNIFPKLIALTSILLFSFIIYALVGLLPSLEAKFLADKKNEVKQIVETAYSALDFYDKKVKNGDLSIEEAQQLAIDEIKSLRFDENNYFWINDTRPYMVMHPFKPKLDGTSLAEFKDPNGIFLFNEMAELCKSKGGGFVEYMWPKAGYNKPQPKISYVKLLEGWNWIIGAGIYVNDVEEEIASFRYNVIVYLVIIAVLGLVVGGLIARELSNKVKELAKAANEVANGNVDVQVEINNDNELGKLASSFNKMVNDIKISLAQIQQKSEEAQRAAVEAESAKERVEKQREYLTKSVDQVLIEMEKFAKGDLTAHLEVKSNDEIGKLFSGFNNVIDKVSLVISQVQQTVELNAASSNQISVTTEEMSAGAQEQSTQSEEIVTAVEEMTKTILETSHNSNVAFKSSSESSKHAKEGIEKVTQSIEKMQLIVETNNRTAEKITSLAKRTDQIGNVAKVMK